MPRQNISIKVDAPDSSVRTNIVRLRSVYEEALKDSQQFALKEFDDALALAQQDLALVAQLRVLGSISEVESSGLGDVLLKFEICLKEIEDSDSGMLSQQSRALLRSIHEDLIRIADARK